MTVELSKEDLINLVKGTSPDHRFFDHPLVKACGSYSAVSDWQWNKYRLAELTEAELWKLYNISK